MSIMYNPHNNKFMLKRRRKEEVKRGKSLLKYHWGLFFLQPHSIWKAAMATRRKTLSLSLFAELFMLLGVNPQKWIESYKVWIYWITQVFALFFVCNDFALRKYFGLLLWLLQPFLWIALEKASTAIIFLIKSDFFHWKFLSWFITANAT